MIMKRVIIVGAGASGLMAAITAARQGAAVTVLEQMESRAKSYWLPETAGATLRIGKRRKRTHTGEQKKIL